MRRIAETFSKLRIRKEGALIAYVTAGDPEPSLTPQIVEALVDGGADIVELGIPFSDPIADGPVIQAASLRALKAGTTPKKVLRISEKIRERSRVPLVIMTYYNPIFKMGLEKFFESAKSCGIDGVIVPDLPVEEAIEYKKVAEDYEIDTVFLASPATSIQRLRKILEFTSGFLYLVSVFGVTGTRNKIDDNTIEIIGTTLQIASDRIPIAVGFGVSKPEHVKTIIQTGAHAAIVGSALVKIIEKSRNNKKEMLTSLKKYAHNLKEATTKNL